MKSNLLKLSAILITWFGCEQAKKTDMATAATTDTTQVQADTTQMQDPVVLPDSAFVVMNKYARGFYYDMKYATEDNFLKKVVYECDDCLLRKEVADALIRANLEFNEIGLYIKFFDCYRPVDVQKQMWEIFPQAGYVANPYTTGSIHNRGGAVDITLVDSLGLELPMGTPFDFFGKEAGHAFTALPDTVLANRILLKTIMEAHDFAPIATEWWHYNYKTAKQYALSNFSTACDEE